METGATSGSALGSGSRDLAAVQNVKMFFTRDPKNSTPKHSRITD